MKNIFHANGKQRKAEVAILISDKIDLKIKTIRDKERHYIMIKGSVQEEDIISVNIYAPNIGEPQYIRQTPTDRKGESDSKTVIVGDCSTHSHQWTDHQNRKLIRKHVLNYTLDEIVLINIFRISHPNPEEYTFSNVHGAFSRIDHFLGHKSNLSKFKKIEIVLSTSSDHSTMRQDINYKRKTVRN